VALAGLVASHLNEASAIGHECDDLFEKRSKSLGERTHDRCL
jgi:hypothetical protein